MTAAESAPARPHPVVGTVAALHRYPLKSGRGDALDEAVVEPWGLAGDRRWMVVDGDGTFLTARSTKRLLLVHAALPDGPDGVLRLAAPGRTPLDVAPPALSGAAGAGGLRTVTVWSSTLDAAPAGSAADAWLSEVLCRAAHLVHLDDPTRRATNQDFSLPGDRVSFADGYPLLVTTTASLAALDDEVLARWEGAQEPVPMSRFRPNLVVTGTDAWAEDDWRRIQVGTGDDAVVFRAVKGCARCVMTTLEPDPADGPEGSVTGGKEPLASLARLRRWDGKTWFGTNLVPDLPAGSRPVLRVGDPVTVLEAAPPGGGPIRPA